MDRTFLIAEIGQAHDGSLGLAHSFIDALKGIDIDAVKFQLHIADAESSELEPFRIKFSYQDDRRFDYWKRMEFTLEQWVELKKHCENNGFEFIASPFSVAAVDLLEKLDVKRYKVGSGEVTNFLLLHKLALTKKEILLSSGMSSFEELDKTIEFLDSFGSNISLFQCTTAYPTKPENWGLNVISELKQRYNRKVGFSDHSGDITAGIAARTFGAELLEFHTTFDKCMFGPDSPASLTIEQVRKLSNCIRELDLALEHNVDKATNEAYTSVKNIFEKSIAVNKDMKKGSIINIEDLETKKPKGYGIDAKDYQKLIGKQIIRDLNQWDFLNWGDFE